MKPPPFRYLAPSSLDEALAARAEHGDESAVLAGGQSLMPLLNLRFARPAVVIDLGGVPELAGIRELDGGLAIGAMTRQRVAERSELDAQLVARSVRGERTIAARDFFHGFLTTALEPDELLVEVRIPAPADGQRTAFLEVARRHGDFALVGVAAVVTPAEQRLAFAGVGPVPVLADGATFTATDLDPSGDVHATAAYRRRVAATLARRALESAA